MRAARSVPPIAARRTAVAALVVALVGVALAACGAASHAAPDRRAEYTLGDLRHAALPSYLPRASASDALLIGTAARPALTEQGDPVELRLADGRTVRGTVTGPVVPGEGMPVEQEATTATFTVTLSGASAPIALDAAEFRSSDHLGHVYPMSAVDGAAPIPSEILPGQTVRFELRAVMITGEGVMQWAPDRATPLAEWDFVVEDD